MLNPEMLSPSTVLAAMVRGLKKSKSDPNFVVKMDTYGSVEKKIEMCYGCCATLALVEVFGEGQLPSKIMLAYVENAYVDAEGEKMYSPNIYQTNIVKVLLSDDLKLEISNNQEIWSIKKLKHFEDEIDAARLGCVSSLIQFFGGEVNKSFDYLWELNSNNWEEQLHIVEKTIVEMIAVGL